MVHQDILPFLTELRDNNTREWFAENKARYDALRLSFNSFVEKLILGMQLIDNDLRGISVSDCTYRIYRDVRFSLDKSPYKTNIGAYLVRGGKKSNFAGYYIHFEPDNCFVSGGLYMPEPSILKAVRTDLYENIEEFTPIMFNPEFVKTYGDLEREGVLTRPPKGFSADFEYIEWIKLKHYTVMSPFTKPYPKTEEELLKIVLHRFEILKPFNQHFNKIIENM